MSSKQRFPSTLLLGAILGIMIACILTIAVEPDLFTDRFQAEMLTVFIFAAPITITLSAVGAAVFGAVTAKTRALKWLGALRMLQ